MAVKSIKSTDAANATLNNNQLHRQFEGVVVSGPKDKTIHVKVKTIKTHPKYRKQYLTFRKYAVHDEMMTAKTGETVVFAECRPISKTKKWRLVRVIKKD